MAKLNRADLKSKFEHNDIPSQTDFENLIDSCINEIDDEVSKETVVTVDKQQTLTHKELIDPIINSVPIAGVVPTVDAAPDNNLVLSQGIKPIKTKADAADIKADAAVSTANESNTKADSAVNTANEANTKADSVVSIANEANTKADNAVSVANEANTKVDDALDIADEANTKADNAVSTANSASDKADDAYSLAETNLTVAKNYTDVEVSAALTSANGYTDTKASETLTSANNYTDTKSSETLTSANGYTDTEVSEVLTSANSYTDTKASETMNKTDYLYSYGVEWDVTVASPDLKRIGSYDLHRLLPIQSKMKGCLLDDNGRVTEYLNPNDWSANDLSGASGQVMVEIPQHYRKFNTLGNIRQCLLSEYPLNGYHLVKKQYISAFEASIQRSTGKLCSVKNTDVDYRGGYNQIAWDGTYRSQLGMPVTSINRTNLRIAARKRNNSTTAEWNCMDYNMYKNVAWLFIVEYATLNSQKTFNAQKEANGFSQGGLGDGVTNINGTKWNDFNSYYPFIPCGYTASSGNNTAIKLFTMPFEYDAGKKTPSLENYQGIFSLDIQYYVNNYTSSGNDLYKCIKDSLGNNITNTEYFTKITRTTTNIPTYRGIENLFGHIWKITDGINIDIKTDIDGGTSKVYVANDPSIYNDNNYNGYELRGLESRVSGFTKEMIIGEFGDIIPILCGTADSGSSSFWCDYHWSSLSSSSLRMVLFGGSAAHGSFAGFGSAASDVPSNSSAYIGSRLCFIPDTI